MITSLLPGLRAEIAALRAVRTVGRVSAVEGQVIEVAGLGDHAGLGDMLHLARRDAPALSGEIVRIGADHVAMLPEDHPEGVRLGDRVVLCDPASIAPSHGWVGRVIDPYGRPLDGKPLSRGAQARALRAAPPAPAERRAMGARLETGSSVFNTFLPIARGQRLGLFAGSGVGKSMLLGDLARGVEADMTVIALIGERGRELRDFVEDVLGPEGMARSIVVAATSDRSALTRRRCAWTAMTIAEHFRDQGLHVMLLADSITRFAEAHREVAIAAGESPSLRGFPPSTAQTVMGLCERAGPGTGPGGDITALFSVLVAGSDMDEPVADILRGVLDGHVVLDRAIAERGRFPAIDLSRSVSRSLPGAASEEENALLLRARQLLGAYTKSEAMIRAGLYTEGGDEVLDRAVRLFPHLDDFIGAPERQDSANSYARLALMLRRSESPGDGRPAGRVLDQPRGGRRG